MEVPLFTDDFLRRPVHLYPNKTAVVDGARRYTYAELQARVNSTARLRISTGGSNRN